LLCSGRGVDDGSQCENAMTFMECYDTKKESNCCLGSTCGNRRIAQRSWSVNKIKVFDTQSHGWGVKANVCMKSDDLMIEYVGEIVSEKVSEQRMIDAERAGSRHVYMMQLANDCVVDASKCGNASRFINHSCEPNCELQRWRVGDEIRIGIFAIHDIQKNEELTYDYQLSAVQSFECRCGSNKCRGTLKHVSLADVQMEEKEQVKKQEEDMLLNIEHEFQKNQKLTSKQKSLLVKYLKERDQKRTLHEQEHEQESLKRLNLTGKNLPGTTSVSVCVCVCVRERERERERERARGRLLYFVVV